MKQIYFSNYVFNIVLTTSISFEKQSCSTMTPETCPLFSMKYSVCAQLSLSHKCLLNHIWLKQMLIDSGRCLQSFSWSAHILAGSGQGGSGGQGGCLLGPRGGHLGWTVQPCERAVWSYFVWLSTALFQKQHQILHLCHFSNHIEGPARGILIVHFRTWTHAGSSPGKAGRLLLERKHLQTLYPASL